MGREGSARGFHAEINGDKLRKSNGKMDGKDGLVLTLNLPKR